MIDQSCRDVFDTLIEAGNDMIDALAERDLERFTDALDLRTRLIDRLRSLGAPSNVRANWEDIAQRIAEQDRNILASAKSLQEEIASQIAKTAKMGQATRAYGSADRSKSMFQGSLHG
jgi:hypothetical protein